MQTKNDESWRLAFILNARDGDVDALEHGLGACAAEIHGLAGGAEVRLGIVDRHPDLASGVPGEYDDTSWRTTDASIELTLPPSRVGEISRIARSLREIVLQLAAPGSVEVMAGPMFPMVPQRDGDTILSLAFSRYPGTTSQQFRDWWRFQHAGVAIPVLGPGLLAYDQVHVDHAVTKALAKDFGGNAYEYDAYDNLTWASPQDYLHSLSDAEGMARIFADEVERIDNRTRRHAMLRRIRVACHA